MGLQDPLSRCRGSWVGRQSHGLFRPRRGHSPEVAAHAAPLCSLALSSQQRPRNNLPRAGRGIEGRGHGKPRSRVPPKGLGSAGRKQGRGYDLARLDFLGGGWENIRPLGRAGPEMGARVYAADVGGAPSPGPAYRLADGTPPSGELAGAGADGTQRSQARVSPARSPTWETPPHCTGPSRIGAWLQAQCLCPWVGSCPS